MSKFAKKAAEPTEVVDTKPAKVKADKAAPKAEKSVKAKAEKPAKAEKKEAVADTRKITLVTKENPKRQGSAAYDRFELYKKAKTVQAFYDAGGTSADLRFDVKAGHVQVD